MLSAHLPIFLEVNGEYENVVDEFLRDELNLHRGQELGRCGRRHASAPDRSGRARDVFLSMLPERTRRK